MRFSAAAAASVVAAVTAAMALGGCCWQVAFSHPFSGIRTWSTLRLEAVLDEDLNILNRWYLWDNNTHPTESHKYFGFYQTMVNKNIKQNNVEVIYLLGLENEILFDNIKNYFTDLCFESKTLVDKRFSVHKIVNCKK